MPEVPSPEILSPAELSPRVLSTDIPYLAQVTNLTVGYGAKNIIEDMNLQIPEGCIGLLGPNGAGKSTLIKTLLGFLVPKRGSGEVLGLNVATNPREIRQKIGLMPEQDCHIPGMNAVTFVAYAGELAGMPASQALRRAHEVLEYCTLGEARYRNVETYSTGMKQRIKLAQALVHGPKLLFLDEPTNGLDPRGRDEMLDLIHDVSHGKGLSVIVSSHLLPDIERTCDHVIVVKSGKVVRQGGIHELKDTGGMQIEVELREFKPAFGTNMGQYGGKLIHQQGSQCRFQFETPPQNITETLFAVGAQSDVQIRGFRSAERSLEDIFLEAVG
jgi:ABC-2 type transport system ATP-binding protein